MSENVKKCAGNVIHIWVLALYDTHLSCAQEMCLTGQISYVQEMCMKCHLSCFVIFSFIPESAYRKCKGNVLEMSCVLTTRNVPKTLCVLVQEVHLKFCPILHQEKSRKCQNFLLLEMSMPCELSCTFHGISYPGYLGFLPV